MPVARKEFLARLRQLSLRDLDADRREVLIGELLAEPAFAGGRTLVQHVRARLYGGEFGRWLESELETIGKKALVDLVLWSSMAGDEDEWGKVAGYFNHRIQVYGRKVREDTDQSSAAPYDRDVIGNDEIQEVDNLVAQLFRALGDDGTDVDRLLRR